jgi:PTS system N-acetylglucosamine-specific IIC component
VVLGPIADEVAREIRGAIGAPAPSLIAAAKPAVAVAPTDTTVARAVLAALGGAANVRQVEAAANRLLVALADPALIDLAALRANGMRGLARIDQDRAQLIFASDTQPLAAAMTR